MAGIYNHLGQHVHDIDKRPRVKAHQLLRSNTDSVIQSDNVGDGNGYNIQNDLELPKGGENNSSYADIKSSISHFSILESEETTTTSEPNSSQDALTGHQRSSAYKLDVGDTGLYVESAGPVCKTCRQREIRRNKSPLFHNAHQKNTSSNNVNGTPMPNKSKTGIGQDSSTKRITFKDTPAAYVLYSRPDTPPKYLYQKKYMKDLSQQLESKELERRRKAEDAFQAEMELRKKAAEQYQNEENDKILREINKKTQYYNDLSQQVKNKPKPLPRALSFNKEPVFGAQKASKQEKYMEYQNAASRASRPAASNGNPAMTRSLDQRRNAIKDVNQHLIYTNGVGDKPKSLSRSTTTDLLLVTNPNYSMHVNNSTAQRTITPQLLLPTRWSRGNEGVSFEEWAHKYNESLCSICHHRLDT